MMCSFADFWHCCDPSTYRSLSHTHNKNLNKYLTLNTFIYIEDSLMSTQQWHVLWFSKHKRSWQVLSQEGFGKQITLELILQNVSLPTGDKGAEVGKTFLHKNPVNHFPPKYPHHSKSCHLLSTRHMPGVELYIHNLFKSWRLVLSYTFHGKENWAAESLKYPPDREISYIMARSIFLLQQNPSSNYSLSQIGNVNADIQGIH